jgi:thiamine biosynthesis lipoprotein
MADLVPKAHDDATSGAPGVERCRPLLGTFVEIAVRDASPEGQVESAIARAFEAIERVDRLMSFHRADSDLSRLNGSQPGAVLLLDAWTCDVLRLALELNEASDGLFDPGVGAVLVDWRMLPTSTSTPTPTPTSTPASKAPTRVDPAASSVRDIEMLGDGHVRLRRHVCLDLGGIAKGFAVDRAIDALRSAGIRAADVNAGGDLRILGPARPVHVRDPDAPGTLHYLGDLADGALATSAAYFSGEMRDGAWRSALVDPRTRSALPAGRSFTVVASSCAVADALAKVLAIAGTLPAACATRYEARGIII